MLGRLLVLAVCAAAVSGCYVYTAAPPAPAAGTDLLLELNDVGRVGLGDSIGSSARVVEGRSVLSSDSAYTLKVSKVGYMNGQSNDWAGEHLIIPRGFVSNAREKTFSRSRTGLTAALVTAAVAGFIASRGLFGFGNTGEEPKLPPPNTN
jgi:hypothetical protein